MGLYNGAIWVSDAGSGPCPSASCWHKIDAGTPAAPVTRMAVHPTDPTTVYAAFSGFGAGSHLFKRTGGGAWSPLAGGLPADGPVNTVTIEANDPQRVWVGTDAGVYKSTDGGGGWNPLNNGMPNVPVYQISLDEVRGRAWAGTHGRGAFVLTKPMVNNFEGWVDGGIWDIPVYGTGFLNTNQSCTVTILRQDGSTCASGSTDGDGGAIKTDGTGQLVTSKGAFYMGRPVVWGCLNGKCVGGGTVAACNQPGNPITSVIVNCNGEIGIEHVNGCQQQNNPPTSIMGLDGTPGAGGGGGGGGGPLGAPALPPGPEPPPPPANAEKRAFFVTPTVQAGDGSTHALCSVRVPFTVGEERARIIQRASDLINASATCAAAGVTARTTGIFPVPHGGEDLPGYDPHLILSAPPVKGSQLMPAFQSDPGQAAGLCFDLQGLGVATSGQLEITRVRFATAPGGAAGGALRFTEISGVGTCEIDVPTAAGQTAGQVAQAVAAAFNTPGIPGPFPRCQSRENPRDVVRDGDSVLTVLPHALRLCVGDAGLGIAIQPDELKSRYPVANAGFDHEVHSTTVKLDGSHSTDPDSTPGTSDGIVQYLWFEVLPDASTVPLGAGPLLTVHLAKGFHHVVLRITNKAGLSDTATVVIEVEEGAELGGLAASVFLSQAYARSDDGVLFGIPHHGTTDYRDLALRLSYGLTTDDEVVVQLRNQRRGLDPRPGLRSDVDADWAFYEHRFGSGLDVRAGRTPVPVGIWNERREAGTRLPFFAAPAAVYQEGGAVNETVDGLAARLPRQARRRLQARPRRLRRRLGPARTGARHRVGGPRPRRGRPGGQRLAPHADPRPPFRRRGQPLHRARRPAAGGHQRRLALLPSLGRRQLRPLGPARRVPRRPPPPRPRRHRLPHRRHPRRLPGARRGADAEALAASPGGVPDQRLQASRAPQRRRPPRPRPRRRPRLRLPQGPRPQARRPPGPRLPEPGPQPGRLRRSGGEGPLRDSDAGGELLKRQKTKDAKDIRDSKAEATAAAACPFCP